MPKLTETQLVILSAAAARDDGAVLPVPASLKAKGGAVTSVLDGLRKKRLVEETPAAAGAASWREAKGGQRMTLVITAAGREAIEGGPAPRTRSAAPAKAKSASRTGRTAKKGPAPKAASKGAAEPSVREGTKQALLIDLLARKNGATIEEAVKATGWQAHSVRGAISGGLKKKLGMTVTSEKIEGRGRVYRVVR